MCRIEPHPFPLVAARWSFAHMGEYLRAKRIDACLTVHDLARESGVDRARLLAIESGWNTLGEHHWDGVCRALPLVDRRVLAYYQAKQNRPPWWAGPRRFLSRIARHALPTLVVFIAGTIYGALLINHRDAAAIYGLLMMLLYGAFSMVDTVLRDD